LEFFLSKGDSLFSQRVSNVLNSDRLIGVELKHVNHENVLCSA
jgi:hypothetical protein